MFKYNQFYSGIIQVHSDLFRTLCNHSIFKTLVYSEPETDSKLWHIQKPLKHRRWSIFENSYRLQLFSQISFFTNCKISFSSSLLYQMIITFLYRFNFNSRSTLVLPEVHCSANDKLQHQRCITSSTTHYTINDAFQH